MIMSQVIENKQINTYKIMIYSVQRALENHFQVLTNMVSAKVRKSTILVLLYFFKNKHTIFFLSKLQVVDL